MNTYKYTGSTNNLVTKAGILVSSSFTRIVHGGRGAYVEFEEPNVYKENLCIPIEALWRVTNLNCYYIEYRTIGGNIKIYLQKKRVDYADYRIGMYYVSPIYLTDFEKEGGK